MLVHPHLPYDLAHVTWSYTFSADLAMNREAQNLLAMAN